MRFGDDKARLFCGAFSILENCPMRSRCLRFHCRQFSVAEYKVFFVFLDIIFEVLHRYMPPKVILPDGKRGAGDLGANRTKHQVICARRLFLES